MVLKPKFSLPLNYSPKYRLQNTTKMEMHVLFSPPFILLFVSLVLISSFFLFLPGFYWRRTLFKFDSNVWCVWVVASDYQWRVSFWFKRVSLVNKHCEQIVADTLTFLLMFLSYWTCIKKCSIWTYSPFKRRTWGHVQCINILTWLRGFQEKIAIFKFLLSLNSCS